MKLLFSPSNYPFFNLALEEYLSNFTDKESEYLLFYRNEPSLVMGKNQNAWEEMNYNYLRSENIYLSRRISGGGTVYHDLKNLNFSYIKPLDTKLVANYNSLLLPIVEFLKTLDLKVSIGQRSDIWLENTRGEERKITGTAQYTNKNRFITHGTLLFDTNLENLQKAITIPKNIEVSSRSLKSIRSKVINIKEVLEDSNYEPIPLIETFEEKLAHFVLLYFNKPVHIYTLIKEEVEEIEKLAKEKYSSFEWIWGRSPACEISRIITFKKKKHSIEIKLNKGAVIEEISLEDESLHEELQKLVKQIYKQEELERILLPIGFTEEELKLWL